MGERKIYGYQVRNKHNNGIRLVSSFRNVCVVNCPSNCVVWSTCMKAYGIKLRFFWMASDRKVGFDKYANVVNFFHLHVGWELMKREVPLEIVYDPEEELKEKEERK